METAQEKVRIAILGGGIAAITTAYELTNTQELCDKYDVTIYQLGWRIGGKGASGRNAAHGYRIEEHGLHVWFGFYENAFQIMQRCYAELERSNQPLATWQDAFKPCADIVLCDNYNGQWYPIQLTMPKPSDAEPGQGKILPNFWEMTSMALQWAWEFWEILWNKQPALQTYVTKRAVQSTKPVWWERIIGEVQADIRQVTAHGEMGALRVALHMAQLRSKIPTKPVATEDYPIFCALLEAVRATLWELWESVGKWLPDQTQLRILAQLFDTGSTVFCGILKDTLIERGFDVINDLEFSEWLAQHGAHPQTLQEGILVRGVYDMAFAYLDGRPDMPNFAAGAGVRALLRLLLTYQGAFSWKMQAGMGDTVFAPFYQVLQGAPRNVHFKFFHAVSNLGLSADKKSIETITVIPQVELTGAEYNPLIEVNQLACWPSEPCWEQLKIDDATRARLAHEGKTFENTLNPLEVTPLTLRKGQEFDLVVLGIPVGALKPICQELYTDEQNPAFKNMLDNARTIITQSFQLWLNQDLNTELGWPFAPNSLLCSYVEPLDTYANMTHLLDRECWPPVANVQDIAYFCGAFPEPPPGEPPTWSSEQVKQNGINFLKHQIQPLWPHSIQPGPNAEFNWNLLVDLENNQGEQRFNAQFWRANTELSERYVLTPAKLVNYRLRTDEAGYDNLYLTGDWIKTGMDAGCIEATVMAGMQAARAICGSPTTIVGEKDNWL